MLQRRKRSRTICTACANGVVVLTLCVGWLAQGFPLSPYADPLGSMAIGFLLLYSSYDIFFRSLGSILDQALEEGVQLTILRALVKYEQHYLSIERIRSRRGGEQNYIELSLVFDGKLELSRVRDRIEEMKHELEQRIPSSEVIIIPLAKTQ